MYSMWIFGYSDFARPIRNDDRKLVPMESALIFSRRAIDNTSELAH